MKKIKVKLVRILTYENKKESKQEPQWLDATIVLDEHVDLGDFMCSEGLWSAGDIRYKINATPWHIQTVTPLDVEGKKREKKRNVKTIREINESEQRAESIETPNAEVNIDNAGSGEDTEQSLPDNRTNAKC